MRVHRSAGRPSQARFTIWFSFVIAWLPAACGWSQADWRQQIDVADLKRHCSALASDAFEGRAAGTRGGQAAAAYLITELRKLGVEPAGDGKDFRQAFGQNYANVIGRLPGGDPTVSGEFIVVGAHYDHVGYGNSSNSYGPYGQIHNGADDNASGVAVLLEIAQALRSLPEPLRRTVVLAAWDAEEVGLKGSQHWVSQAGPRIRQVKLAINLDMIGRMQRDRVLTVGWRSAAGLRTRLAEHNGTAAIAFHFEPQVMADSDHYSFYAAQIPTLHFDTGKHADYHRPSDDIDKLQWDGMVRIGQVMAQLIQSEANTLNTPAFRPEAFREPPPRNWDPQARQAAPVRLGVSWKPEELKNGRVEVLFVSPQSPAHKAGIQPGDQLLGFHRWREGTDADLRTAITTAPADVQVTWRRRNAAEPQAAEFRLLGEPTRCGLSVVTDAALPGAAVIAVVMDSSPADRAGLQPGDILMRWGEGAIPSPEELSRRVQMDSGEVPVIIERDGRVEHKTLNLPPLP